MTRTPPWSGRAGWPSTRPATARRPARSPPRCASSEGDWLFPTYRDSVAVMARGVDPVQTMTLLPRRLARRLRPRQAQGRHPVHAADHPAAPRRRRGPRRQAARRGHRRPGHVRRRRHQRGRLPRGAELRRGVPPAGRLLRAEQPVRDLGAAGAPVRRAVAGAQGRGLRHGRANAWTATTSSRCSPCWAGPSKLAREGSGPLLVEAHTYRMQAHTNADDATRYRQDSEVAEWVAKDPLSRMKTYLTDRGLLDDERAARIAEKAEAVAAQLREGLSEDVPVDPQDLFSYVFSAPTPQLKEQSAMLADELARDAAASDRGGRTMSPTITTSSEANGNVSAATARAAAKAAAAAEQTGPQTITLAKALNTAMADAMHADPSVLVFGEDVGMLGGVFRITDGLTKTFGEEPLLRHPAGRIRDRGHGRRHGDERHAPGHRDAVRRLRLPGVRTDRQPRRQDAQPHQGRRQAAHGHPGPVRRRHRGSGAPLRLLRGLLRAHRRPEGLHAGHRGGRLPHAPRGHRLRRPRDVHGAQEALLVQGPGGPGRAARRARRERRRAAPPPRAAPPSPAPAPTPR